MIDPATGFFEIVEIGQKTADIIASTPRISYSSMVGNALQL